jgi:hypothetical protein
MNKTEGEDKVRQTQAGTMVKTKSYGEGGSTKREKKGTGWNLSHRL